MQQEERTQERSREIIRPTRPARHTWARDEVHADLQATVVCGGRTYGVLAELCPHGRRKQRGSLETAAMACSFPTIAKEQIVSRELCRRVSGERLHAVVLL